jgi:hypothetical protein
MMRAYQPSSSSWKPIRILASNRGEAKLFRKDKERVKIVGRQQAGKRQHLSSPHPAIRTLKFNQEMVGAGAAGLRGRLE